MSELRVELHCHTDYSPDSDLKLPELAAALQKAAVNAVAITDHNTIEGALKLKEMATPGLTVIVGQEITTAEGDLIGLFLKQPIEPGLPVLDAIVAVRSQGGLVIAPHPFDRVRKRAMGKAALSTIVDQIDFVEAFNARCVLAADNAAVAAFAREYNLHTCVASDAHTAAEIGTTVCLMVPFTDVDSFAASLRIARFETKLASPLVHLKTALVKRKKLKQQA